ncbi:MAG: FkbM family methyltransferase [Pirellulaceae bacterium]
MDFSLAKSTEVGRRLIAGSFEPEVAQLVKGLIRKTAKGKHLFIDVGANIGYFPLLAKHMALSEGIEIDCYAHEPLPELLAIAQHLKRRNGIDYALSPLAVGDFTGRAKFYVSSQSDSSSSLAVGFRKAKDVIEVDVSTLDNLYTDVLSDGDYQEVLIMIDVETGEPAVLRGGEGVIRRFRPLIICEVLAGRTEVALTQLFDAADYSPFRFDGVGWVLDTSIFGDKTYTYRDWFFVPNERQAEFLNFFART